MNCFYAKLKHKAILLFFICCVFSSGIHAKSVNPVIIKGFFKEAKGKEARLLYYSDYLTNQEFEKAQCMIGDSGFFSFEITVYEPQYVFLKIDFGKAGLYIEPGKDYELYFDTFDFSAVDEKRNPFFDPVYYPFKIKNEHNDGLNTQLGYFEPAFNAFVTDNFSAMWKGRLKNLGEAFEQEVDSVFSNIGQGFFKDYIEYKFAKLYLSTKTKIRSELASQYLVNKPVLYQNPAYMDFFNAYFEKYFLGGSNKVNFNDLDYCVNQIGDFRALMDTMGKDTILVNEVLREMVLLKSMGEIYSHQAYQKEKVIQILSQVKENSKFSEHRAIAGSYIQLLTALEKGKPLLPLIAGEEGTQIVIPDTFSGKYIYLMFFTSWCSSCELEFEILRNIYSRYEQEIAFVGISTDKHKSSFEAFKKEKAYPWPVYYLGNNMRAIEKYRITTYPTIIMVNRQGRIVEFPAPKLSDDIENYFRKILSIEKRGKQ